MKKRPRVDLYLPLSALPDQSGMPPQAPPHLTARPERPMPQPVLPKVIEGGCVLYRPDWPKRESALPAGD